MDIFNNDKFYQGFEGEPEVIFQLLDDNNISVHVWDGYISDMMRNQPGTDDDYRLGLSRDWNTLQGPYADKAINLIDVDEYYNDLIRIENMQFEFEDTKEVYKLIMFFLKLAKDNNQKVEMIVD